jgi:ATP-binding cassette subfamily C protein CydC/ATP-binding cassette subfamily C protein CydCD
MSVLADVANSTSGRTVVMVSHRPEGLDDFDEVIDLTPAETTRTATSTAQEN